MEILRSSFIQKNRIGPGAAALVVDHAGADIVELIVQIQLRLYQQRTTWFSGKLAGGVALRDELDAADRIAYNMGNAVFDIKIMNHRATG